MKQKTEDKDMKKFTKTVSLLLALLILAALLCACGSSGGKNIPVSDVVDAVGKAIGKTDLSDPGESYVKGYMKRSADEIGEYSIRKNVIGTNIDEFGVFKAEKLSTAELKEMIEGYLKILNDSWMNYQPEEKPKLDGAEVKVAGDYVMYAILSDADRTAAFGAFESALK